MPTSPTKFHKGQIPWNKGKVGFKHSEDTKAKIGAASKGNKYALGRKHSEKTKELMSTKRKGKKMPDGTGAKISASKIGKPRPDIAGERNHMWKGGVTKQNEKIRKSIEYKFWRTAVFERDNYTCVWCGTKCERGNSVYLNADHIKPFAYFPELRFAIDNGRTLCRPCHLTTDTWGAGKKPRTKKIL